MRNSRFLALALLTSSVFFVACPKRETPKPTPTPTPAPTMSAVPLDTPDPTALNCDLDPVYFDFDAALIRSEFRTTLKEVAECLEADPKLRVSVAGHADQRGTTEYNLALGERRAHAVRDYLINLGIAARRMNAISYGEERPAVQGDSEDTWSKNRRVEFER